MQHKDFSMSFVDFKIIDLSFFINKKFENRKTFEINPSIAVAYEYKKRDRTLTVQIKVTLQKGNVPFFFNIEGGGRFVFKGNPDDESINKVSTINCPAIIFPYIRETIADITRRAGFPPLHLPPVNFIKTNKSIR
jgi:preprotein translocase subunit SecB